MKNMMKLMVATAIMACAIGASAQSALVGPNPFAKIGSVTTAANTLVFTNTVPVAGGDTYKQLDQIALCNNSSETGTVAVALTDAAGVFTTIQTTTLNPGGTSVTRPLQYTTLGTTSNTVPYLVKDVRLITTLNATNAVVSTVKYSFYAK